MSRKSKYGQYKVYLKTGKTKNAPNVKTNTGIPEIGIFPGSEYDDEQLEWLKAIERYQRRTGNRHPTAKDILEIARQLGYKRTKE